MNRPSFWLVVLRALVAAIAIAPLTGTSAAQESTSEPNQPAATTPAEADTKQIQIPQDPAIILNPRVNPDSNIHFFKDLLRDQKAIFKSPLDIKRSDLRWLAPLGALTTVLIVTDSRASNGLSNSSGLDRSSHAISSLGSGYVTAGTAGAFYGLGTLTHNDRARQTGVLALEAIIDSAVVSGVLKFATGRGRPSQGSEAGRFGEGGNSMPSGHTATMFALATVVARQYHDKPLVRVAAYGIATAVGISRFTGRSHFPSDVLVGATVGHLVGEYVVRRHYRDTSQSLPAISPYVNRATRTYGVGVSFHF